MSFKDLLRDLVKSVEGVEGAVFLDEDGEAVDYYSENDSERLKLRSACVAPVMKTARAVARAIASDNLSRLVMNYDGAILIIEELELGYFLMLELQASASVGEAVYRMKPIASKLRSEIAG